LAPGRPCAVAGAWRGACRKRQRDPRPSALGGPSAKYKRRLV